MALKKLKSRLLKRVRKPEIGANLTLQLDATDFSMLANLAIVFVENRQNYYLNPVSYVIAKKMLPKLHMYTGKLRLNYAEGLVLHGLLSAALKAAEGYPQSTSTFNMFLRSLFVRIDDLLTL